MTTNFSPNVSAGVSCHHADPLDIFFAPASIAVFGATDSPDRVGGTLMSNLIRNPFGGIVYPISRSKFSVHGVMAYPGLAELPEPVELALVATPAPDVPDILEECLAVGVKAAIIMSTDFDHQSPARVMLGRQIRERLRPANLRIVGPNSFGIACPRTGLNATFAPAMPPDGKIGFLSQSNALLTGLLAQEHASHLGCSAFISVGSLLDISWAEWLEYLANDAHTECLGIYAEEFGDARAFFAAARKVALHKPVILIKSNKGTGEVPIPDDILDEACRCSGVLRVRRLADLFRMAAHLTSRPSTPNLSSQGVEESHMKAAKGRRLGIVTNSRGPALLAVEALHEEGGTLAKVAPQTVTELGQVLSSPGELHNPVYVGQEAIGEQFIRVAKVVARDPNVDALLVMLAPSNHIDTEQIAEDLCDLARTCEKPVLACWLWGGAYPKSLALLRGAGIIVCYSPEAAVRNFGYLWRHGENLHRLAQMNTGLEAEGNETLDPVRTIEVFTEAQRVGRAVLTESEIRELFSTYGMPVQGRWICRDQGEAVRTADTIGYPVLIELVISSDSPLPPDDQVVRLRAENAEEVRRAVGLLTQVAKEHFRKDAPVQVEIRAAVSLLTVEVSVIRTDLLTMGPLIRIGKGDRAGDEPRRVSLALTPLSPLTAQNLVEEFLQTTGGSWQAPPPNLGALESFLLRLSRLAVEQSWIKEIALSALLAEEEDEVKAHNVHVTLGGV